MQCSSGIEVKTLVKGEFEKVVKQKCAYVSFSILPSCGLPYVNKVCDTIDLNILYTNNMMSHIILAGFPVQICAKLMSFFSKCR